VKIKSKQTMSGQSYENTTYIKGKRQRTETMNGMMVNLTQCDLRRGIQMNPQAKTYMVNSFGETTETVTKPAAGTKSDGVVVAGGKITTTITTKDTGERKQMFGFTAKHLIITMETISSPDACTKNNSKMQTDGWYIDAEFVLDCDYGTNPYGYNNNHRPGGCQDKYEMKQIGAAKRGYPVYEKMTMFDESGKETMSLVNEVTELSKATLDASLFDVPQDYRQVTDASQMYAASVNISSPNTASMSLPNSGSSSTGSTVRLPNVSNGNDDSSAPTGPKKSGIIRVGLAGVKIGAVGQGLNASDLAAAVQNTLIQFLKVPNLEVVTLDGKLASAIDSEAKQKECDFVIYSNVSHKKGGGGGFGSMFGSALGSSIASVGIGHTGSVVGNIAGQVATQAIVSATSMSANVKSKDEITLDLKLTKIDGSQAFAKIYKAKAKSDGEDIISGVIEQAAQAIVDTVGR
jgi:hypothetical protein